MDQYNWPSPQRTDTMYLSSIGNRPADLDASYNYSHKAARQSTFLNHDIPGAVPRRRISTYTNKASYNLSSYVQPTKEGFKHSQRISDALRTDDIEGAQPRAVGFQTKRAVNPLNPMYILPTANPISVEPPRKFIRDNLRVEDITSDISRRFFRQTDLKVLPKEESRCRSLRVKTQGYNSQFEVKDIINEGVFVSSRITNPLNPRYVWKDEQGVTVNNSYGQFQQKVPSNIPAYVGKDNTRQLNTADIQGATHNSCFDRMLFLQKRRHFKNCLQTDDIQGGKSSSLKKGIVTNRVTNPLVPRYQFLGHSQLTPQSQQR